MSMRPCYRNNAIDTTPRGRRHDTRTNWLGRIAYDADLGFWEALVFSCGVTLLTAVIIWGVSDLIQAIKPFIHL